MRQFVAFGIAVVFALAINVADLDAQCCGSSAPVVYSGQAYSAAPAYNSYGWNGNNGCCNNNCNQPRTRWVSRRRARRNNNCAPTNCCTNNYSQVAYAAPVSNNGCNTGCNTGCGTYASTGCGNGCGNGLWFGHVHLHRFRLWQWLQHWLWQWLRPGDDQQWLWQLWWLRWPGHDQQQWLRRMWLDAGHRHRRWRGCTDGSRRRPDHHASHSRRHLNRGMADG